MIELAGPDGGQPRIPQRPCHEAIGGRIFMESHPLAPIIIESPDKDGPLDACKK